RRDSQNRQGVVCCGRVLCPMLVARACVRYIAESQGSSRTSRQIVTYLKGQVIRLIFCNCGFSVKPVPTLPSEHEPTRTVVADQQRADLFPFSFRQLIAADNELLRPVMLNLTQAPLR